jgi:hypothetical protein
MVRTCYTMVLTVTLPPKVRSVKKKKKIKIYKKKSRILNLSVLGLLAQEGVTLCNSDVHPCRIFILDLNL